MANLFRPTPFDFTGTKTYDARERTNLVRIDNLARLDDSLCLSCGQCLVKCPRGVITDQRGILHK